MGIPQTSVSRLPAKGVPGTMSRPGGIVNGGHVANGVCYPGRWVTYNGDQCAHPASEPAFGVRGGVVLKNEKSVDGAYADKEPVAVLEGGFVLVDPEVAVTRDTQAYVRYVTPGSENKGDFRADEGGATGGVDVTVNTAANSVPYTIGIRRNGGQIQLFEIVSSGSATPTNVASTLATEIDADANLVATNPSAGVIRILGTTITDSIEVTSIDRKMTYVDNQAAFKAHALFRETASTGVVELEVFKQL
jgi:hypothetical protein